MKILDKFWFRGGGIVRVLTDDNEIKYYISGIGVSMSEYTDSQHIADWGNSFPKDAGDVLFGVNK